MPTQINKATLYIITLLSLSPSLTFAAKRTTASIIAREPVTMMDLGLLKINSVLSNKTFPELRGATIGANYNAHRGTIDLKVSKPVKKSVEINARKPLTQQRKYL